MRYLFLCLFTGWFANLNAQEDSDRLWEEGSLSLNDFKGISYGDSSHSSHLHFELHYSRVSKKVARTSIIYMKVNASMQPKLSWLHEVSDSTKALRYPQLQFNTVELYARKLQKEFHQAHEDYDHELQYQRYWSMLQQQLSQIAMETKKGKDETEMRYWEQRITKELEANSVGIPQFTAVPALNTGLRIGAGAAMPFGNLGDKFSPLRSLQLAADFSFHKFFVDMHLSIGSTSMRTDFLESSDRFSASSALNRRTLNLNLGYEIFEEGPHTLTPFIGYSLMGIEGNLEAYNSTIGYQASNYFIEQSSGLNLGLHHSFDLYAFKSSIGRTPYATKHGITTSLWMGYYQDREWGGITINLAFCYRMCFEKQKVKPSSKPKL